MKSGSTAFYHPELDALRFGAFFLVFLAHSVYYVDIDWGHLSRAAYVPMFSIHGAGYYGVDLFFVLSSYLITELLLREKDKTGSIHLPQFYTRRILRIWPLYFFFLLAVRPLVGLFVRGEHLSGGQLAAFLLLVGNWNCVWWGWPPSIASQLWSVTMEEQFYLVWPLALRRWSTRLPGIAVGMLWVASLTRLAFLIWPRSDSAIWCNTLARLDPLAGGILLASWLHGRENWLHGWIRWQLTLGAAALLLFVGYYGDHTDWRALFSYPIADLACVMLVAAVLVPQGFWRPGFMGKGFVYLGQISYGLYVYHLVGFELAKRLFRFNVPVTMLIALLLSIGMAAVSYHLLEMPFLKLKRRFTLVRSRGAELTEHVLAGR